MNPNEVVVHVMERQRGDVVLDLFRERIGQSGKPAHLHPERQIAHARFARPSLSFGDMPPTGTTPSMGKKSRTPGEDPPARHRFRQERRPAFHAA